MTTDKPKPPPPPEPTKPFADRLHICFAHGCDGWFGRRGDHPTHDEGIKLVDRIGAYRVNVEDDT